LVGFYDINDNVSNGNGARIVRKTLLFQSAVYGYYKFLPVLADWKSRAVIGNARSLTHSLEVENIERTPEVVQRISNDESRVNGRKCGPVNINMDPIYQRQPKCGLHANDNRPMTSAGVLSVAAFP
jgi:hypothetical protein